MNDDDAQASKRFHRMKKDLYRPLLFSSFFLFIYFSLPSLSLPPPVWEYENEKNVLLSIHVVVTV